MEIGENNFTFIKAATMIFFLKCYFSALLSKSYDDYDPGYPTTASPPRRSPPRRSPPRMPWGQEQPPSRGPYRSNSPPPPSRFGQQQPGGATSITDKWSQQMSNIANKRNDYNDAFERLAEQEAQREAERLQEVSNNKPPQVIDLSDSDEGPETQKKKSMIPSPPRLSDYPRNAYNSQRY